MNRVCTRWRAVCLRIRQHATRGPTLLTPPAGRRPTISTMDGLRRTGPRSSSPAIGINHIDDHRCGPAHTRAAPSMTPQLFALNSPRHHPCLDATDLLDRSARLRLLYTCVVMGCPDALKGDLDHRDAGGYFSENQHPGHQHHLELRQPATQYSIGYVTSSHDDKAFRRIAVRILPRRTASREPAAIMLRPRNDKGAGAPRQGATH